MLINIIILCLFICYVNAEYHLTVVLISAPKKVPMLTFTVEYFLNAYNYNHDGFVIDGFYLSKGCDCNYPELYEAKKALETSGIRTIVNGDMNFYWKDDDMMEKMQTFHSWWSYDYVSRIAPKQKYETTHLYMRVNSFFNQTLQIIKEKQGYPEYILFLEDDVAFHKSFFVDLKKHMPNNFGKEHVAIKVAYPPKIKQDKNGYFTRRVESDCPWGFWGILMDTTQLKKWEKVHHYIPYGLCADRFHCSLIYMYDKKVKMLDIAYHFGRDHLIVRKDRRFWNK